MDTRAPQRRRLRLAWVLIVAVAAFQLLLPDSQAFQARLTVESKKDAEDAASAASQAELEDLLAAATTIPVDTITTVAPATTTPAPVTVPPTQATTTVAPTTTITMPTPTTLPPVPVCIDGDAPINDVIGYIYSPRLSPDRIIMREGDVADDDKWALDQGGVAHRPTTEYPLQRPDGGNFVVTGHRTSYSKDVFGPIDQFVESDQIEVGIVCNGRTDVYLYSVEFTQAGVPADRHILGQAEQFVSDYFWNTFGYDTLTLASCDPPGSTTHRYVVRARMVSINGIPL